MRHTAANIKKLVFPHRNKAVKNPKMEASVLIWFIAKPSLLFLLKAQKELKQLQLNRKQRMTGLKKCGL